MEVNVNPAAAPVEAPAEIKPEPPPRMMSVVGGITSRVAAPSAGGVVGIAPPPPPPPQAPIRVGGAVQTPTKVKDVPVVYPPIARAAKVQGIVIIEAIISKDGSVQNLKVLRGNPMLDQAALDAVRQWRYSVPTLNGTPVDVIMTVTVNFTLN
jgi:protein TonB